jgi:hypothetical protein
MVSARSIAMGLCLGAAAAAGCGDDDGTSATDAGVDGPGRPTRTVSGQAREHHVSAPGVDEVLSFDLSGTTFGVFIPDTMATLSDSGRSDSTFRIANVPEGEYYLRLGTRYMARTTDTVDLDYYEIGRLDALPATMPTTLFFSVTDLAAWQTDDTLELYSPSARTAAFWMDESAGNPPAVGATSLAGFAYDLMNADNRGLPSAAHDDQLTLTQLATQQVGGHRFLAVARAFLPRPFTVSNGDKTTVDGTFMTPASVPLALTWDRPAFDAELRAHSPGDEADTASYMTVAALPDADLYGYYSDAPRLVIFDPGYTTDRSTLTTTGWSYADPFPPTWTRFALIEYYTYQFIGDVYKLGSISQYVDLASVGTAPIQPTIGLPVDVQVNGRDAFTAQSGVGLTPTISWSPPTFGTADKYLVRVYEVPVEGALVPRALLETTRTSVIIPPGIMIDGNSYAFMVMARAATTLDAEATPFRESTFPGCITRVTTAFVSP